MQKLMMTLWLATAMAFIPLAASAQSVEEGAYVEVVEALAKNTSHADIIKDLIDKHGMTLSAATVFAMVSGGQENRVAFAEAGVGLATNLAQAQGVATAVKATAGDTGAVATAVDVAVDDFAAAMSQPSVYEQEYSPTGGGQDVSPS